MEVREENRFIIRGSIVGKEESAKRCSLTIATSGGFDRKTFPKIFFYDRKLVDHFNISDRVLIRGIIHNHFVINPDTGKKDYQSTPIGQQIYRSSRLLHDYYPFDVIKDPDGGAPDDKNEVMMAGKVTMVYKPEQNKNLVLIKVRCDEQGKSGFGQFSCFSKCADIASTCKPGDFVIAAGYINTDLKEKNGGRKVYQSIICRDIYKVED